MGYRSDVALAFTKENWDKIIEESKTDEAANNKFCSFKDIMRAAKVYDTPDSKILKFNLIKWYDSPGNEGGIDFLQRMQKKYDGESLIVGEDLATEHDYPNKEGIPEHFTVDYNIFADNVDLSIYDKTNLLEMIAKDYKKNDPENYKKFVQFLEDNDKYLKNCSEFKKLFY